MSKTTAVIGASPNPDRYAFKATRSLKNHGHKVFPVGIHRGEIDGETILLDKPALKDVDTVTLYVGPRNQVHWKEYILGLHPKRIIFNPGTENPELEKAAEDKGIECVHGCTLVMLSIGDY
jgi:predicted CoA-binding protein